MAWRTEKCGLAKRRVRAQYAEAPFQFAATRLGDSDRAALSDTFDPAAIKQIFCQADPRAPAS